jgi:putative transposase
VAAICLLYEQAQTLSQQGIHLVSTDEMTGIQALERARATLPMKPGFVERQEFEYIRHGTVSLIANLEIATGLVSLPALVPLVQSTTSLTILPILLRVTLTESGFLSLTNSTFINPLPWYD